MELKKLPIGIEFFETIRKEDYYYVDKTRLIRDILDERAGVYLFTRPRRFGKTLNMTMLQAFFERTDTDNRALFRGLAIEQAGEKYWEHHKRYPVIFLTMKSVAGLTFADAYDKMAMLISREASRHNELETSELLSEDDVALYHRLRSRSATPTELSESLNSLCGMLEKHHREKVILLIDEYDVPLDKAFFGDYYRPMIDLMRNLLGVVLKTNPSLHMAVLTGCLRVSRESIFTGLNNIAIRSIRDISSREHFGFTTDEVTALLTDSGVAHRLGDAKGWYNGYRFANVEMYNPWDIVNFCSALRYEPEYLPQSYWVNTSGNDIIRRFIDTADRSTRLDIEHLIDGESITKPIRQELTYAEIDGDPQNLWSFLLVTGYLTIEGKDNGERALPMRIPNAEIREIFVEKISEWFRERIRSTDLRALYAAVLGGDAQTLEQALRRLLMDTISYHDALESFYHGFLVGILRGCDEWTISSNREAGAGRSDIQLEGIDMVHGAVIELKQTATAREMEPACRAAIAQIREKAYTHPLMVKGYEHVLLYGIAFCGKTCRVLCEESIYTQDAPMG